MSTHQRYQVGQRVSYVDDKRIRRTGRIIGYSYSMFNPEDRTYAIRPDHGGKDIDLFPHVFTPIND